MGVFYLEKYQNYKELLKVWFKSYYKEDMICSGVAIKTIIYNMAIPKSASQKLKDELDGTPHLAVPDKDNLEKAVLDGMSGIVFRDDCLVWYTGKNYKLWSQEPSTIIDFVECNSLKAAKCLL